MEFIRYKWAQNIHKLQRAYAKSNLKTEEDIKQVYVEMGGLLTDLSNSRIDQKPVEVRVKEPAKIVTLEANPTFEKETSAEIVTTPEEIEVVKPKRGRPAKNAQ